MPKPKRDPYGFLDSEIKAFKQNLRDMRPGDPDHPLARYYRRASEAMEGFPGWRRGTVVPRLVGAVGEPLHAVRWTIEWAVKMAERDLLSRKLRGMAKTFDYSSAMDPYGFPSRWPTVHDEVTMEIPVGADAATLTAFSFFDKYGMKGLGSVVLPPFSVDIEGPGWPEVHPPLPTPEEMARERAERERRKGWAGLNHTVQGGSAHIPFRTITRWRGPAAEALTLLRPHQRKIVDRLTDDGAE